MSENNSTPVGGFLAAFTIGALVGAGIALLYAPRSGEETRRLLAAKTQEFKGKARDGLENARGFLEDKKAEISAAVVAGKEAMAEERSRHQRHI